MFKRIVDRFLKKPGYKYLVALVALGWAVHYLWVNDPAYVVKHHKNLQLICQFEDGVRIVPKNKIVAYIDDENTWSFTDGWASNCSIVDEQTGTEIDFRH